MVIAASYVAGVELREWSGLHTSRGFIFRPWMPWQRSSRQRCAHCCVNKATCSVAKVRDNWECQYWPNIPGSLGLLRPRSEGFCILPEVTWMRGRWLLALPVSYMAEPLSEGQWKNVQINFFAMCFSTIELCWTFGICIVSLWGLQTKFWATMEVCETSSNAEALAFGDSMFWHTLPVLHGECSWYWFIWANREFYFRLTEILHHVQYVKREQGTDLSGNTIPCSVQRK